MTLNPTSAVHRQVAAVQRRLFIQSLIRALAWSLFAALAVAAVMFLAEPLLFPLWSDWLRWTVLGAAVVAGTAAGAVVALRGRTSPVQAALALDEQFRLKERVTTSLLLRPDEAVSPAGAALLADANQRVDPLRVGERFPVRVPWTAALAPLAAVAALLVICFYHPHFTKAQAPTPEQRNEAMKAEIDPVQEKLQQKSEARKKDPAKSEELKKVEADIDHMVNNKHDTPKDVEEDIKKGDQLQDALKKQDQAAAQAERELKDRLDQLQRAAQDKRAADDLAKKLDADQKADELKKKIDAEQDPEKKQALQDELKKNEAAALKPEDRDKAKDELKDLKEDANRLEQKNEDDQKKLDDKNAADQKKQDDDAKKLEEDANKPGADKDQIEKDKDQLQKDKDQLKKDKDDKDNLQDEKKDLQDAARKLDQAQQAMQQGKDGDAAKQLQQAGDKMGQAGKGDDGKQAAQDLQDKQAERDRIAQDAKQVQEMKQALSKGLAKQEGQDGKQGDQAGDQGGKQGGPQGKGDGPNPQGQPANGSGARPEGDDAGTGQKDHRIHTDPNDKGQQTVIDHVDGPTDRFSGPKKPEDMKKEIIRAAQEGEAAADNEKVTDKGSADTSKEWFQAIRPPDEKKPK